MSYVHEDSILEERNGFRVRLVLDQDADQPYDETGPPLVRIYPRSGNVESLRSAGSPQIAEAVERWGTPASPGWKLVEKYLRAFHGTQNIETYYSGEYWYIAFDTEDWIKSIGFDDVTAPRGNYKPWPMLAEWKAWVEGDVYGYIVEKQARWAKMVDGVADESDDMTTWETVDSCWGFYGDEYAKEAALEAFTAEAGEIVKDLGIKGQRLEQRHNYGFDSRLPAQHPSLQQKDL